MAWLEIIEIRVAGNNRELLESQLLDLVSDANQDTDFTAIHVYRDIELEVDFSIHLFHDSVKTDGTSSATCSRLISSLRDFGLLNHKSWVEISRGGGL